MDKTTKRIIIIGAIVLLGIGLFTGQFGQVANFISGLFGGGPVQEEILAPEEELPVAPPPVETPAEAPAAEEEGP